MWARITQIDMPFNQNNPEKDFFLLANKNNINKEIRKEAPNQINEMLG